MLLLVVSFDVIGTEVFGILDSSRTGTPSVSHSQREVFAHCTSEQCGYRVKHQKTLTVMASPALQADDHTCPSSYTTYALGKE